MLSSFKGEYETILDLGADVVAVGRGDVESHRSFAEALGGCPFPIASDPDLAVARAYEAVEEDGRTGRRAVYVIDENGTIAHRVPWYQPGNVAQFMGIFQALGLE